jgi:hypothetical protein
MQKRVKDFMWIGSYCSYFYLNLESSRLILLKSPVMKVFSAVPQLYADIRADRLVATHSSTFSSFMANEPQIVTYKDGRNECHEDTSRRIQTENRQEVYGIEWKINWSLKLEKAINNAYLMKGRRRERKRGHFSKNLYNVYQPGGPRNKLDHD